MSNIDFSLNFYSISMTRLNRRFTRRAWQLQEAKAHFSEVVKEASLYGPQEITLGVNRL